MYVMIGIILIVCSFMSCTVMADLLPTPTMGDFPLHRIGMEIVIETVTATAGGGMLLRWLVKKGWKKEKKLKNKERNLLSAQLNIALPVLKDILMRWKGQKAKNDVVGKTCSVSEAETETVPITTNGRTRDTTIVEQFLQDNPEVIEKLQGVPIEWVAKALVDDWSPYSYWASSEDELEYDVEIRRNWVSPSVRLRRRERTRRLLGIGLSCVVIILLTWLAWRFTWWLLVIVPVALVAIVAFLVLLCKFYCYLHKPNDTETSNNEGKNSSEMWQNRSDRFCQVVVVRLGDECNLQIKGLLESGEITLPMDRPILVGRSRIADVRVPNTDVSGRHLEISITSSGLQVKALSHRGSTTVDGKELAHGDATTVSDGSEILLGIRSSVKIVVKEVGKVPSSPESEVPKEVTA